MTILNLWLGIAEMQKNIAEQQYNRAQQIKKAKDAQEAAWSEWQIQKLIHEQARQAYEQISKREAENAKQ